MTGNNNSSYRTWANNIINRLQTVNLLQAVRLLDHGNHAFTLCIDVVDQPSRTPEFSDLKSLFYYLKGFEEMLHISESQL